MTEILCVKIAQREIKGGTGYQYFPYDRVYLVPRELRATVFRMFRYFFEMDLDNDLLAALTLLKVTHERTITVDRDDKKLEGKREGDELTDRVVCPEEWLLIVPTHIKGRKKEDKRESAKEESVLMYRFSKVLQRSSASNAKARMPRISLHTPYKEIPLFCAVCTRILDFHDNKCSPGKGMCSKNAETILPADAYFHEISHATEEPRR